MTVVRRLGFALFAAAVAALGWAAPAAAILPPADGNYTYAQEGAPTALWQLQTVCIQPNGTRAQQDYADQTIQTLGCTVTLRSFTPQAAMTRAERQFVFTGKAKLAGGMWTFQIASPEGLACPNGGTAPTTETFAFAPPDPNAPNPSVTGLRTTIHGAVCGLPPAMVKAPFALNYTAPLEPPVVSRFPAQCDYLVGRPSICS
jgi:hypothetical protein